MLGSTAPVWNLTVAGPWALRTSTARFVAFRLSPPSSNPKTHAKGRRCMSKRLIWVEGDDFTGWCCFHCTWGITASRKYRRRPRLQPPGARNVRETQLRRPHPQLGEGLLYCRGGKRGLSSREEKA